MSAFFRFTMPLLLCVFFTGTLAAQNIRIRPEYIKANSNWIFNSKDKQTVHLNFNSNPFVKKVIMPPSSGAVQVFAGNEAGVVVSDTGTGALLFYSNSQYCKNKNFKLMPNGDKLFGFFSTHQGARVIPMIGDPQKYYLFTLEEGSQGARLHYSIVDMALDNGLGDVVASKKNILLDSGILHEGMLTVPGNNCDMWLMVHNSWDTMFKAYHITKDGINTTPVKSSAGAFIKGNVDAFEFGGMSLSPDRTKIAITSYSMNCLFLGLTSTDAGGIMVMKFDPESGKVSDGIKIGSDSTSAYSSIFSADNSKLYVYGGHADPDGYLSLDSKMGMIQYDLTTFTKAAIDKSEYYIKELSLTPDIYRFRNLGDSIILSNFSYIKYPNRLGAACDYKEGPVLIHKDSFVMANVTLGDEVNYPLPPTHNHTVKLDTVACKDVLLEAPAAYSDYLWDNDSTGSTRYVTESGKFWISYNNGCHYYVDTFVVTIPHPEAIITTDSFILGTTNVFNTYQWILNGNSIPNATDSTYTVSSNGNYQVIVTDTNGCLDTSAAYVVDNYDDLEIEQKALHQAIIIYPNPAIEMIYINAPIAVHATISTIEGRIVQQISNASKINIHDLAPGIYLIKLRNKDGAITKIEKFSKIAM